MANALAHSNYYERRGVVVVKKGKEITISNPGTIRITKEEFYAGGNSDPRNPNILKMFGFVNVGERAGSGVDKIMTAWKEQNWKKPEFDFSVRADRVTLKLEVGQVVYIPGAADLRVEEQTLEQKTSLLSEKEEAILGVLPGNNCGGCGYPGCDGLAAAIAAGKAPVNGCPVGGNEVAKAIAAIMGEEIKEGRRMTAFVKCAGDCESSRNNYVYDLSLIHI